MTVNLIVRSDYILSVSYMLIYCSIFGLQDIYVRAAHIIGLVNIKFAVITKISRLIHVRKIVSDSHQSREALLKLSEAAE